MADHSDPADTLYQRIVANMEHRKARQASSRRETIVSVIFGAVVAVLLILLYLMGSLSLLLTRVARWLHIREPNDP